MTFEIMAPKHWQIMPCRKIVTEANKKNYGQFNKNYLSLIAKIGVIPYEQKGDIGNKKPDDLSKCKLVSKGDFLINSMNFGIGSYGISPLDGVCSPVYIVLKPNMDVIDPRFAFRIFEDAYFQQHAQSLGNGILAHRCSIRWDDIKSIKVGVPPLKEQEIIANFLDRETSKIDKLITKQNELIKILKEKLQVIISNSITKGINLNVPMKDSCKKSIGYVPEHWGLKKMKYIIISLEQGWSPQCEKEPSKGESPGVLKVGCVNGGVFNQKENKKLPPELTPIKKYQIKKDDLLISRANTRELVGSAAVVKSNFEWLYLCDKLYRIKTDIDQCIPDYVSFCINSSQIRQEIEMGSTGASQSMQNISQSIIKELIIPIPPLNEQKEIINYLTLESKKIFSLINQIKRSIQLHREKKSSLISAAVTGQIDLRSIKKKV